MREIKFRGKRVDNGEWIYGNYLEKIDPTKKQDTFWAALIHDKALTATEVIPETVGQFTGLLDKNGKEIYEGDILNIKTTYKNNMADKRFQDDTIVQVGFINGSFIDLNTCVEIYRKIRVFSSFKNDVWTDFQVIGNIHENK